MTELQDLHQQGCFALNDALQSLIRIAGFGSMTLLQDAQATGNSILGRPMLVMVVKSNIGLPGTVLTLLVWHLVHLSLTSSSLLTSHASLSRAAR